MAEPVVEVDRVGKQFKDTWAVSDLSFSVNRAEIVGLLGPNGAGKTTTLSMLLGLLVPTTGRIRLFGLDIASNRQTVLARTNFSSPYASYVELARSRNRLGGAHEDRSLACGGHCGSDLARGCRLRTSGDTPGRIGGRDRRRGEPVGEPDG